MSAPDQPIPETFLTSQDDGSFVVPQANNNQPAGPSFFSRLLTSKRWIRVLAVSAILLAGSLAIALAFQLIDPSVSPGTSIPTPIPTSAVNQFNPSKDQGDDSYFAAQPLTMLYYSFSQTSSNKNVFQALPRDTESRFVDIGFPDRYNFSTSPDGKHLARWQGSTIELSTSAKPATFKKLYTMPESGFSLHSLVWANDGKTMAASFAKPASEKQFNNKVLIVALDDTEPKQVLSKETDHRIDVRAVVDNRLLYFAEDRNGLYRALTEFNLEEGQVVRQLTWLDEGGLLATLQTDRQMIWGYAYKDNVVSRYNLSTMAKETLYEISRTCPRATTTNSSSITALSLSPSGKQAIISVSPAACRNSSSSQDLRPRQVVVNTADGKVQKELFSPTFTKQPSEAHWSPDESLVWLQYDSQTVLMTKVEDLSNWPVPPTDRALLTKERPVFLGWLVN